MSDRSAYRIGLENLAKLQHDLKYPPKRKYIPGLVEKLIKGAGLKHDPRREHFRLLAHCALLGKESLYNNFKSKDKGKKN